ncbi:DNA ligase D [Streptoalloteichus tenebrarius]|uniref:DNA ligase D n=1 Tax=Streptoalloteichus tenebrarius (strain ATCC 17920 / DSM 40477 / JCM 4838 / CBS 697.72 / NBRC 16177 / NCIMB 11028 / NRRL B-12390 / A12253. 1 / ISP 5477) TaxID=1933 RepID=A0ABT1HSB2_STRSD|nr:non-homologous end-joining DNA ligase [Streptoalloteichus tenebrarius]MCP2258320.1 DNA ligase D [Streptoalloteichus tenebrarius]BFF03484.1 DNA polymerase domain-containing protein [Streptoalloteichus tenebrarius]
MAERVELTVPGPDGDRVVRVSNLDKVYFPERGITKGEVLEYYLAVAEPLLRAVRDRPTMLKRYPDGVTGEHFYSKRVPRGAPDWVRTVRISFPSGRHADEICPTEPGVLLWAANLGTFDFHPWPVRRDDVDRPDELRVDLDPQPGTGFGEAVRVAGVLREVLDEAGIVGYPKTSGGRGVHVLARIRPEWDFVHVRRAVIALARAVERRMPGEATTAWWKEERGRRVFLDYNQAARDRTIASAWSVRGTPRATVSMPVTWESLPDVDPDDFDVRTAPGLLAEHGDPHLGLDDRAHGIEVLLDWFDRDDRDHGLGEMPYPPEYPKMPGEPPRVQPSRRRRPSD